jgi:VCBS repeat-containing protein
MLLQTVNLPKDMPYITNWMFWDCGKLQEITIPASVNSLGKNAFSDCDSLKKVTVLNRNCDFGTDNLAQFSSNTAFYGYANSTTQTFANTNHFKFTALTEATAGQKVSSITLSGNSTKIAAGKKITLKATVSPSNAANKAVSWTSSNTKYATVSSTGVVTTKTAGKGKKVTITATAKDGSKVKATYAITIMKNPVTKITLSGSSSVKNGKSIQLTAKVTAGTGANKTLRWTSSNKTYATVNASGKVTALKAGKGQKVTITASATDGSGKKASKTIKIK